MDILELCLLGNSGTVNDCSCPFYFLLYVKDKVTKKVNKS